MKSFTGIWFLLLMFAGCDVPNGPEATLSHYIAYLSADDLADKMVNEDPSLIIVDIRPEVAYKAFSLPGAVNIPLDTWLGRKEEIEKMFLGKKSVVLVDDKGVGSRFASAYLQENEICDPFILDGGLEGFVRTIYMEPAKDIVLDNAEMEKQRFREAAAMYFVGLSKPVEPEPYTQPAPAQKKTVKVAPKKKIQQDEEEGC